MKAGEIFTPTSQPGVTYYNRSSYGLEQELRTALATKGTICSISGPSKSGKTVLCEQVVPNMRLITGSGISDINVFWTKLRQELDLEKNNSASTNTTIAGEAGASGEVAGSLLFLKGKAGMSAKASKSKQRGESQTYDDTSSKSLFRKMSENDITLVVDDFHYIAEHVQIVLAQEFKEAAREGARIVVLSVTQRSDQAIRANKDLIGRVLSIDIPPWEPAELEMIPRLGFKSLNAGVGEDVVRLLVRESLSSPQLMQNLCLRLCGAVDFDETQEVYAELPLTSQLTNQIFERAAASNNYATTYSILQKGPKPRGSKRNLYKLASGREGDIYTVILHALASGEPVLTIHYQELKDRVETIIAPGSAVPRGVELANALTQMSKSAQGNSGAIMVLDYDEERATLNILEPHFLYYLRWARK